MGDVLRTTSILPALKRKYPYSHVTWITRQNAAGLLVGNVLIDRILTIESNYLESVLVEQFDLALGPDADALSSSIMTIIRSPLKRGFVSDGRGGVSPLSPPAETWWHLGLDDHAKRQNRRTYGQFIYDICELDGPVERPMFTLSAQARDAVMTRLRAQTPWANTWICFNTGASNRWREKQWRVEQYRALATLIGDTQPRTAIALSGGPAEVTLNQNLLSSGHPFTDGATGKSFEEFASVVSCSDWLLTPDSLGYHLGCAVGTPTFCVVGPTSPWELDLYGVNKVLHTDVQCISCYQFECKFEVTCMDALTASSIAPHMLDTSSSNGFTAGVYAITTDIVPGESQRTPLVNIQTVQAAPHVPFT